MTKCFDLTLKGYNAFYDMDDENAKEFTLEQHEQAEALVKWVQAPSKEALDKFITKNDLAICLDETPYLIEGGHVRDSVSLAINEEGDVISENKNWKEDWLKEVNSFAEVLKV